VSQSFTRSFRTRSSASICNLNAHLSSMSDTSGRCSLSKTGSSNLSRSRSRQTVHLGHVVLARPRSLTLNRLELLDVTFAERHSRRPNALNLESSSIKIDSSCKGRAINAFDLSFLLQSQSPPNRLIRRVNLFKSIC
jgi:hypothetical protein